MGHREDKGRGEAAQGFGDVEEEIAGLVFFVEAAPALLLEIGEFGGLVLGAGGEEVAITESDVAESGAQEV